MARATDAFLMVGRSSAVADALRGRLPPLRGPLSMLNGSSWLKDKDPTEWGNGGNGGGEGLGEVGEDEDNEGDETEEEGNVEDEPEAEEIEEDEGEDEDVAVVDDEDEDEDEETIDVECLEKDGEDKVDNAAAADEVA